VKKAESANALKWFRIRKRNNHSALPLFETGVKQRERFIIHETGDLLSRSSRAIASRGLTTCSMDGPRRPLINLFSQCDGERWGRLAAPSGAKPVDTKRLARIDAESIMDGTRSSVWGLVSITRP